ncbi:MAG: ATP-binding protein [Lachnospiraceae bacterium]|nr:ATP-binding protein [Lachnospiraceae bacterium]
MYRITSRLLIYANMPEDSVLMQLSDIFRQSDEGTQPDDVLVTRIYSQIKHILEIGTDYGFDNNLWHNYLTFVLLTQENPFSLTAEKVGASVGTVNTFARSDYRAFMDLFHFDFNPIEKKLGINCFSLITNYQSISKKDQIYNKNVSEKVRALSLRLGQAMDENEFFDLVTGFYKAYGVGMFGLNKAFRISRGLDGNIRYLPINNMDTVTLDDLIGYEIQKQKLVENTEAFVNGRKANNCLLYGDSGTGKSTSIKAIVNAYYDQGLRMIEIYKHQFKDLSAVIAGIKNRNYRFIIYMDDLSFEPEEVEYKFLKAVIEGGVETKPENVLIYATSNRRHLIRENWNDRNDMEYEQDLHRSDTMEEKLSLVSRFGVQISYTKPQKKQFNTIVIALARRAGISPETISDEELCAKANMWELSHGGTSGRTAQQFVDYLCGTLRLQG